MIVVHAYELPPDFLGRPEYDRSLRERQGHAEALIAALPLQSDELAGPEYEIELIGGSAARTIADVARTRDADEIVVGARGVGRVRALLGSVSHELLHLADRPVVVIPTAAIQSDQ